MKTLVLFGGSGFVGTHLSAHLLAHETVARIYIADLQPSPLSDPRIVYVPTDVRQPVDSTRFESPIDSIVNLAAIHRSPGHPSHEYFETNILGARSICEFAEKKAINSIFFTSSISVYGPGEDEKTEDSLTMPQIPYGSSKAIAEYVHREWFNRAPGRALTIVRPAVIFGKGERGNFTRIAHALRKRMFAYPGRKDTIKGCLYVKDLCRFIGATLRREPGMSLFNFCLPEMITVEKICAAFNESLGYPLPRIMIPLALMKSAAAILEAAPIPGASAMGIHPERIMKLVRSTNISSRRVVDSGFRFQYDLASALKDWAHDCGGARLY